MEGEGLSSGIPIPGPIQINSDTRFDTRTRKTISLSQLEIYPSELFDETKRVFDLIIAL